VPNRKIVLDGSGASRTLTATTVPGAPARPPSRSRSATVLRGRERLTGVDRFECVGEVGQRGALAFVAAEVDLRI
jgi:hypothetical protein